MYSRLKLPLLALCLAVALAAIPRTAPASDIFERLGSLTLQQNDETALPSAVVATDGAHAYFGTSVWPPRIVKVDLLNLERVDALIFSTPTPPSITTAMVSPDGQYGYFGSDNDNGIVQRVDLETFTTAGRVTLTGLGGVLSGAMSPDGSLAYFGTSSSPANVVMVDLTTMSIVETLAMEEGINRLSSAAITPDGKRGFFGTETDPASIVRVDLATMKSYESFTAKGNEMVLRTALMAPDGLHVYFGSGDSPARILKVDVDQFEQVETLTLEEGFGSPGFDGEYMVRASAISADGKYAYFGTHAVPGRVVRVDLEAFERVDALTLPDNEVLLRSAAMSPDGTRVYFGTGASPGRVVEIRVDQILTGEQRSAGDLNASGCTDFADFLLMLDLWGRFIDGAPIGFSEFLGLLQNWRGAC